MNISDANEAQKAAILHLRGPCLVLAGPGSGKTFTITKRILYLLEQGAAPETILVITFTKEAALSMQNRFLEISGAGCMGAPIFPVCFGTFHSIFFHILRQSNVLKSYNLLNHSEKKALLYPILKSFYDLKKRNKSQECMGQGGSARPQTDMGEDAVQLLSAISYYKNTMDLSAAGKMAPAKWQPDFADILREYDRAVKEKGRLDFDDMLYGCRTLLRDNKAVRIYWQNRFRHILIDEFQDINPVQYEVVKLLAAKPYNIFAVGDDDQSIYGFRGSEPECMKRFESEYSARKLFLDINYRSGPQIVQASLAVIEENRNRFIKQLRSAQAGARHGIDRESVVIHGFSGKEEQYNYMLRELSGCICAEESCAVLFRTNAYMQGFASRMRAADIPYEMRERTISIYEHFIVADMMAYLQTARGEGTRGQMLRIMNRPSRYISREAVGEGQVDLGRMREYYCCASLPEKQCAEAKATLFRLERQFQTLRGLSLVPALDYVLKAMGYERYLREMAQGKPEKWQEWQELLEWLKGDAARYSILEEWMDFQRAYSKDLGQGRAKPEECSGTKEKGLTVQLLTVHGAKGLEFDRVWIPDCNEKIFPHGKMPDEGQVEEERRIFYVAMTRAKKSLELLYLTGTKERPRLPSRFLNPLYSSSVNSSNSQLSRYSSNASATFSYSSSSSM